MEQIWKYVIALTDETVFDQFYQTYHIEVPEDLQELVRKANAGTPSKYCVKVADCGERVFGALLSYNKEDDDNVYMAMEMNQSRRHIPFAVDPYGNFFYENLLSGDIFWINHENGKIVQVADSLTDLLENLYQAEDMDD